MTALQLLTQAGMLVFVVASMAAVGLGLTAARIVEPLRDRRLVAALLVANFVVVPAAAVAVSRLLPMTPAAAGALILVGCVAGAPFIPKLAQLANGDPALAVAATVLLMVVTIGYAPLVVPLAMPGTSVDPLDIAPLLVVFMLVPLAAGLAARARASAFADASTRWVARASTLGLGVGMVAAVLSSWDDILGAAGTLLFPGVAAVLVAGLAAGWLAGLGRPRDDRVLLGLATAQRNIAAALVVATTIGGETLALTLVGALVVPAVLLVLAAVIGRQASVAPGPGGGPR